MLGVSTNVAAAYLQYFLNKAAKLEFWTADKRKEIVLYAVNILEKAAQQFNEIAPALASAITWLTPRHDSLEPIPATEPP